MKYYTCPICQAQIMYEFDGKKQENAGMRITKHVKLHSLGEVIEYIEWVIVDNFTDTKSAKPCIICQENKPTDYEGYCQQCHDQIAERNVREGTK